MLLCSSVRQAFDEPASLLFSCGSWRVGREAMVMAPPTMCDSAVLPHFCGCLGFLHRHFSPQSPPSHPLDPSLHSQQHSHPGIAPQFLKLQLPATASSRGPASLSGVCMAVARTIWFSFHLGCHRSAVSLSVLNISPLTQDSCPDLGLWPLLQFPHPLRAGPVLPTLLFVPLVPSSYQVFHGSIYSFLLVRYSCPLSAGVLHALLCLRV